MVRKINNYIKIILFCGTVLLSSTKANSFEVIKNVPPRNIYFTGRIVHLSKLQEKLSKHNVVYLTGYGGLGKSQLAKEYCYVNKQEYDLIWWFDLKSDLDIQYKSLLILLSNNKAYKKLLNININDVSPDVLVKFTNHLLSESSYKWLLVFDNMVNTKSLELPKTKISGQNIIITTREKQFFGNNVLALGPFTNKESEIFLSKTHPKEKRKEIVKLSKALYNYPLALAQVGEEILLYENGIESYFKKWHNLGMKKRPMHSEISQEYNNNYPEVLNLTLQDIEQKDREVAKILYMFAMLNMNLTKELAGELFGEEIEEKIIVLNKYGLIQIDQHEHSQFLIMHDIIREAAIKNLNSKDRAYKKEVVSILIDKLKSFYLKKDLQYLNSLDASNEHVVALYAFIDIALQNNALDDEIINSVITALRLNNVLFNKNANLDLYQQLLDKIYSTNLEHISPNKKALLYVVSFPILESGDKAKEKLASFEREILRLLSLVEKDKNYKELFFLYTRLIQFYLVLGDFTEAKKYAEKAQKNINHAGDIFILLRYWYANAWLCYELREIDAGVKALDNYMKLSNDRFLSQVGKLYARDLEAKFTLLMRQIRKAKKEIKTAIKDATSYYNNVPSSVLGELEYTKTLMYFQEGQYKLAEKQGRHALSVLTKVFSGDIKDLTQAHIHIMLGEIYEVRGNYTLALEDYEKSLQFYNEKSYGRVNNFHEYGELLANLCVIYYKLKNFDKSKLYYKKLTTNFGLDHDIVAKLIKRLPYEYMHQISKGN